MSTPAPSNPPDWRRRLDALTSASRNVARDTTQNAAQVVRDRNADAAAKRRLRATSSEGALLIMAVFAAVLWAVQIVNAETGYAWNRHLALLPRSTRGLPGVLLAPYLHSTYYHLVSNTVPFILIGWVVLLAGVRGLVISTLTITVLGGALTWLTAPTATILGSGLLVIGWMGYLVARAVFSRSIKWIVVAVLVLFFFGTLLGALVPHFGGGVSWEAYTAYFAGGVVAAAMLHRRRPARAAAGSRSGG